MDQGLYKNIIFAGGGSRCFWQLGFCDGVKNAGMDLMQFADLIGSASAGCAMASIAVLDRNLEALDMFKRRAGQNEKNVYWKNLSPFRAEPVLPHVRMYREAIEEIFTLRDLERLKQKKVRFLMSRYPRWLGGVLGAMIGFIVYEIEKQIHHPVHPTWTSRLGYTPVVGKVEECESVGDFADIVLASSCVPPVLPGGRHKGQKVLDGGLIDNVPLMLAHNEPGQTLVLLSRHYGDAIPTVENVRYAQPSREIPVKKFDYANPDLLQKTYDLGLEDGYQFFNNL